MAFTDELRRSPSGTGGIFGQPKPSDDQDELSLVRQLQDRNFQNYQRKAEYDQDLDFRGQMRMRNLFDPSSQVSNNQTGRIISGGTDPLTTEQKIQQTQRMTEPSRDFERQKLEVAERAGQGKLDIAAQQAEFNRVKNEQINQDRDLERQRRIDESEGRSKESEAKLALAQRTLEDRTATSEARIAAAKEIAALADARHTMDRTQREIQFNTTSAQQQQRIDALLQQLKNAGLSETVTQISDDEKTKTTTTRRGDSAEKVTVIGRDGKTYTIPKDKADDKDSSGNPIWKSAGG